MQWELRNRYLCLLYFFSGNIFICRKMQSDSPVGPEEAESEADWFLSANVIYKIGESVSTPSAYYSVIKLMTAFTPSSRKPCSLKQPLFPF